MIDSSQLPAGRRGTIPQLWTTTQQKALLCSCLVLLAFLAIETQRKPLAVGDPPKNLPRAEAIQDRLDPNTVDAAALSAIPNLGEIRAAEVVGYRASFLKQHPGGVPFQSVDDLRHVKGIGAATAATMESFLIFPKK